MDMMNRIAALTAAIVLGILIVAPLFHDRTR
jgi:hypothetical protein